MKVSRKFQYRLLAYFIAALLAIEFVLRLIGFGNPVLSQADAYTGYRFQPNQHIFRLGKNIEYNQYSQRSAPITQQKPQGALRILMVGDSVLNGGNPTDQKQIITELLKTKIQTYGKSAEVLNASAGSWGIGNQLGYLKEFGTFDSDLVIMQIGTSDLVQPTSTGERVGIDPNYPTHAPLLATQEALIRYLIPKILGIYNSNPFTNKEIPQVQPIQYNEQFQKNIELFKTAVNLIQDKNIPTYVLFTPNRDDLVPKSQTPPYKPEFMQLLNKLNIPVFDTYETWSKLPTQLVNSYYRDEIHFNEKGNEAVAKLIYQQLCIQEKFQGCFLQQTSK